MYVSLNSFNQGMSAFFLGSWGMHRSAGQTNRVNREAVLGRFVCSALRFIPHEPRKKKTLIPYIYNVSNKDPSQKSPIKVINSKFPQQRLLNIILCINHCACDLPNCRNYLMTLIIGN